jgi:hypothetical protein
MKQTTTTVSFDMTHDEELEMSEFIDGFIEAVSMKIKCTIENLRGEPVSNILTKEQ